MYQKPELKRLERIDPEEYKLICFLRNRRRRIIREAIRFEVMVKDGILKCKEIADGKK